MWHPLMNVVIKLQYNYFIIINDIVIYVLQQDAEI
jgi:hypothetical protein